MAPIHPPEPVKLLAVLLWADAAAAEESIARMRSLWGEIDHLGPAHPFDVTDYYEAEMGPGLERRLLAFAGLVPPGEMVEAKLAAGRIEEELRGPRGRRVNIDIGLIDHHKVVLASFKPAGQKIYLDRGIYADLMLRYARGRLEAFEWTFPDFRDRRYEAELLAIRKRYLAQLRALRSETRKD